MKSKKQEVKYLRIRKVSYAGEKGPWTAPIEIKDPPILDDVLDLFKGKVLKTFEKVKGETH